MFLRRRKRQPAPGVATITVEVERDAAGAFEFVVRTRPELDPKTCAETLRFAARELDKQWSS